jgi:hypothetical protein
MSRILPRQTLDRNSTASAQTLPKRPVKWQAHLRTTPKTVAVNCRTKPSAKNENYGTMIATLKTIAAETASCDYEQKGPERVPGFLQGPDLGDREGKTALGQNVVSRHDVTDRLGAQIVGAIAGGKGLGAVIRARGQFAVGSAAQVGLDIAAGRGVGGLLVLFHAPLIFGAGNSAEIVDAALFFICTG